MHEQSSLQIRPLRATDEVDWRRLWTGYLEYYESTVPEIVYQTTFERLLTGDRNEYRCLLALESGAAVGLAHFLFHRSCWSVEDKCYLQDLFVDPAHRSIQ